MVDFKAWAKCVLGLIREKKPLLFRVIRWTVALYGAQFAFRVVYRYVRSLRKAKLEKTLYLARRKGQIDSIREQLKIYAGEFPSEELQRKILLADVHELVAMLDAGETSSLQLLVVFVSRCISLGVELGAIVEFDLSAFSQAIACDKARSAPGCNRPNLPPLFGVPVSLKSNFILAGTDCSSGMLKFIKDSHGVDGLLVQVLKQELGAIPFVKTNVPTGIVGTESANYIYGRVLNSYDRRRTAGGSSGGEAALVSSGCSPLGFGTDAAGSIRTPCLFSGVYGFMVTPDRVTTKGVFSFASGLQDHLKTYVGPIGKSVRDLQLVTRSLVSSKLMRDGDIYLEARVWDDSALRGRERLKVACLPKHELFDLTAGQQRVMDAVTASLSERGHEVVTFSYAHSYRLVEVFVRMAGALVGGYMQEFEDDVLHGESRLLRIYERLPPWLRAAGHFLGVKLSRSERIRHMAAVLRKGDVGGFLEDFEHLQVYVNDVHKKLHDEAIDALLVPGLSVAYRHDTAHLLSPTHAAHIFPNAARLCAGVVPVTRSLEAEADFVDRFDDALTEQIRKNLADSAGLPLGVQVCAAKHGDETCLRVMGLIEEAFRYRHINL